MVQQVCANEAAPPGRVVIPGHGFVQQIGAAVVDIVEVHGIFCRVFGYWIQRVLDQAEGRDAVGSPRFVDIGDKRRPERRRRAGAVIPGPGADAARRVGEEDRVAAFVVIAEQGNVRRVPRRHGSLRVDQRVERTDLVRRDGPERADAAAAAGPDGASAGVIGGSPRRFAVVGLVQVGIQERAADRKRPRLVAEGAEARRRVQEFVGIRARIPGGDAGRLPLRGHLGQRLLDAREVPRPLKVPGDVQVRHAVGDTEDADRVVIGNGV